MMDLVLKNLGQQEYLQTWQAMKTFTEERIAALHNHEDIVYECSDVACNVSTEQSGAAMDKKLEFLDQFWIVEHPPVFTLGQQGKEEHLLFPGDIPVIATDRGGQVTYHGPGQLVLYPLIDLRRKQLGVRELVTALELSIIHLLSEYDIEAHTRPSAPGVYVKSSKIASVGLRIRRGFSYHGLALNVAMDLEPFTRINPCGYSGLTMTQISDLGGPSDLNQVSSDLVNCMRNYLGYL